MYLEELPEELRGGYTLASPTEAGNVNDFEIVRALAVRCPRDDEHEHCL